MKAPKYPAADTKAGVVWVISGDEKLVAVSPAGKVVAEAQPVPVPMALAARDGLLAVASTQTGKYICFDASNPVDLKPLRTIGRGDGPDGRVLSDRFFFQDNPGVRVDLAIGPRPGTRGGRWLADPDLRAGREGSLVLLGPVGRRQCTSKVVPGRVYDGLGFTYLLDGEQGTWEPESYHRALAGGRSGDCRIGGQTFVLLWGGLLGKPLGVVGDLGPVHPGAGPRRCWRMEDTGQAGALQQRRDTNGDGHIDDARYRRNPCSMHRANRCRTCRRFITCSIPVMPDGTLVSAQCYPPGSWLSQWPCAGLDAKGVPIYRWQDRVPLPGADKFVSPFNWKPDTLGVGQAEPRPGGGWYIWPTSRPAPGVANRSSTTAART